MHEAARRPSGAAAGVFSSIGVEGKRSWVDSCSHSSQAMQNTASEPVTCQSSAKGIKQLHHCWQHTPSSWVQSLHTPHTAQRSCNAACPRACRTLLGVVLLSSCAPQGMRLAQEGLPGPTAVPSAPTKLPPPNTPASACVCACVARGLSAAATAVATSAPVRLLLLLLPAVTGTSGGMQAVLWVHAAAAAAGDVAASVLLQMAALMEAKPRWLTALQRSSKNADHQRMQSEMQSSITPCHQLKAMCCSHSQQNYNTGTYPTAHSTRFALQRCSNYCHLTSWLAAVPSQLGCPGA